MDWGLDTSAVLRILTGDPVAMAENVAMRIDELIGAGATVHVSALVVSESYYALQHHYAATKEKAIQRLLALSRQPGFHFSPEAVAALSQPNPATMSPGLVDRMIAGEYAARGLRVLACEKDFRKIDGAEVVA